MGLVVALPSKIDETPPVLSVSFHIGDVVRKAREEKGWTQSQLAKAAGVNKATVVRFERQDYQRGHDLQVFTRLAGALGTTPAEIMGAVPLPAQPIAADLPDHTGDQKPKLHGGADVPASPRLLARRADSIERREAQFAAQFHNLQEVASRLFDILAAAGGAQAPAALRGKPKRRRRA